MFDHADARRNREERTGPSFQNRETRNSARRSRSESQISMNIRNPLATNIFKPWIAYKVRRHLHRTKWNERTNTRDAEETRSACRLTTPAIISMIYKYSIEIDIPDYRPRSPKLAVSYSLVGFVKIRSSESTHSTSSGIVDTFSIIVEEGTHLVVPVLGVRYPIHVWTE